jgi:hypothetical protein
VLPSCQLQLPVAWYAAVVMNGTNAFAIRSNQARVRSNERQLKFD